TRASMSLPVTKRVYASLPVLEERPAATMHRIAERQAYLKNVLRVPGSASERRHAGIRLRAVGIGADDAECATRGNFLVSGAGRQNDHVAGPGRHLDASLAAEPHRHFSFVDAQSLVRVAVIVMEGKDAVAPRGRPAVAGEKCFEVFGRRV